MDIEDVTESRKIIIIKKPGWPGLFDL